MMKIVLKGSYQQCYDMMTFFREKVGLFKILSEVRVDPQLRIDIGDDQPYFAVDNPISKPDPDLGLTPFSETSFDPTAEIYLELPDELLHWFANGDEKTSNRIQLGEISRKIKADNPVYQITWMDGPKSHLFRPSKKECREILALCEILESRADFSIEFHDYIYLPPQK